MPREDLQVGREAFVGRDRRGDAVPQRRPPVGDQPGRRGVQRAAPGDPEGVVHGRAHEGMRERQGDRRARPRLGQQARGGGLVKGRERVGQLGQPRHLRQRALHAEHGRGVDEAPRGRRAAREAVPNDEPERAWRGQRPVRRAPRVGRELGEQRPGVQRVALGAVVQTAGGHRRERRAHLRGEVAQLGLGEAGQPDDAVVPLDEPAQALREPGDRVAHAEQRQHRVGHQAPQREQQGRERRPVGPVHIVDDHDDRVGAVIGVVPALPVEQAQHAGADRDGIVQRVGGPGHGPRVASHRTRELLDDAVREQRLGLVAARTQHRQRTVGARLGEETLEQRGLAHPGRALDEHDPRTARHSVGDRRAQHGQLGDASDEG